MDGVAGKSEVKTSAPILNLQAEPLTAKDLKQFYDNNKPGIDLDKNGFVTSAELDKFKNQFNPLSREYRQAESLSQKARDIQQLNRDESGFLVFSDSKGISSKDMEAFDSKAKTVPADRLVKSINDDLASKNYEDVVKNAQELNEDRLYLVDLKMQKTSYSLDIWEHLENAAKAEYRTTLVGERQFDKYKVGQTLSSKFDVMGAILNDSYGSYSVSVSDKRIDKSYNWVDGQNKQHALTAPLYNELKNELKRQGRTLFDAPYAGSTHTYISDKPISDMNIVARQPMNRYFIDVEISNSTLTFDWTKQLTNLTTSHRVEMEVPKSLYEKTGDKVWNPKLSTNTFIIGGRISAINGDIKKKWTEVDPDYEQVTTDTGRQFILPKTKKSN